jgi:GxxExxY protein
MVERKVITEIKSADALASVYRMQLLTCLKLTSLRHGLLINFNEALIKSDSKRTVSNL